MCITCRQKAQMLGLTTTILEMLCRQCTTSLSLQSPNTYITPPNRVGYVHPHQWATCIVKEPTQTNRRRGPDDYEPVNLRHAFYDDVDTNVIRNKKVN